MPIEIHRSSDIDDHGEVRTRPQKTPHPVVRARDWCYLSQPEHLSALLHLRVFRTSTPSTSAGRILEQHEGLGRDEQDYFARNVRKPGHTELSSCGESQKMKKKLLGEEFLENQKIARELAIEQSKKRHKKPVQSNRADLQAEIKRQEALLLQVLADIKTPWAKKEEHKAGEQEVLRRIHERTEAKVDVSRDHCMAHMMVPKSNEDIVAWALQSARQADEVVEKELYSILVNMKKFMVLYGATQKKAYEAPSSRSKNNASYSSMLYNLQDPDEDEDLSLSEKLAKQARFINSITGNTNGHRRRLKSTIDKALKKKKFPKMLATVSEITRKQMTRSPASSPHTSRPSSASPRTKRTALSTKSRTLSSGPSSQRMSKSRPQTASEMVRSESTPPNSPGKQPEKRGGFSFPRAGRFVLEQIKEDKTPGLAKVADSLRTGEPLDLKHSKAEVLTAKTRTMSVMSVRVNAAGEEEDFIMTKLCRVDGGTGKDEELKVVEEEFFKDNDDDDDNDDDSDNEGGPEDDEEDYSDNSNDLVEPHKVIMRYTNNPNYQWNSNECYQYNNMFETEEFREKSIKHFNQLHDNREAEIAEKRKEIAEMIVTSNECISKLVRRFVVQHETRDSLLAAVVYRLSLKDFERPDVMQRLWDIVTKKLQEGSLQGHVLDQLQQIKKLIHYNIHTNHMKALLKNKWFLRIVKNLHMYKKKMKTPVPISLLRFLLATSKVLENGLKMDEEMFYFLLEELLEPSDQGEVIVHRSLTIVRDEAGVSAEEYQEYLERNKIALCAELMVAVREIQMKRMRQMRITQTKEDVSICHSEISVKTPERPAIRGYTAIPSSKQHGNSVIDSRDNRSERISESAPSSLFNK